LESNQEIYQELLEPLVKELTVGDGSSKDVHDINSDSSSPKEKKFDLDYE
jgi:hypothetical protein